MMKNGVIMYLVEAFLPSSFVTKLHFYNHRSVFITVRLAYQAPHLAIFCNFTPVNSDTSTLSIARFYSTFAVLSGFGGRFPIIGRRK